VRPIYPESLRAANVDATVVVEGRVGVDGLLKDLRVQAPVEPDLAVAASTAVQQWRWSTTRLDGVPIEVPITITIHFYAQP
jgi:TonB family protein